MRKIRNLSQQHAILFSLAVFVVFSLIHRVMGVVFDFIPESLLRSYCEETLDIIWPVVLTLLVGYGFALSMKGLGKTLKVGSAVWGFFIVMVLFFWIAAAANPDVQWQSTPYIFLGILSMLGVGIREEVIFRGIIGNSLVLKYGKTMKGLWFAILLSSFLFGAVHFSNLLHGVSLSGVIAQLIAGIGFGIMFMAIYLRGGCLWIPIMIHALNDTIGLFDILFTVTAISEVEVMSEGSYAGLFISIPIQVGIALFLLRKSKRPEVFAHLEAIREEYN